MQQFWERVMQNRMLYKYQLAPFLEDAALLIRGARNLWHPWGDARKKNLTSMVAELCQEARSLRKNGLGWTGRTSSLEAGGRILSSAAYYRYHRDDQEFLPHPEHARLLVSLAGRLLLTLLPALKKSDTFPGEGKISSWLHPIIETLMEFPDIDKAPEVHPHIIHLLGTHSVILECEGLAYMQGLVEDSYHRKYGKRQRKKCELSEEELRNLAAEIGMRLEDVREVFSTEHSAWWNRAIQFSRQADAVRKEILSHFSPDPAAKAILIKAWDSGMSYNEGHLDCLGDRELESCERLTSLFVALFLSPISPRGETEKALPEVSSTTHSPAHSSAQKLR